MASRARAAPNKVHPYEESDWSSLPSMNFLTGVVRQEASVCNVTIHVRSAITTQTKVPTSNQHVVMLFVRECLVFGGISETVEPKHTFVYIHILYSRVRAFVLAKIGTNPAKK